MQSPSQLYLDLMKRVLTNFIYEDDNAGMGHPPRFDPHLRENGMDWPSQAHTMVGRKRLDNIQFCAEAALRDGVPGDFVEAGVWRGGSTIFMRAILQAYGITDRNVWVADSFQGLPPPDPARYPQDAGDEHHKIDFLAVSLEEVRRNFERYGLLDSQVRFLKGWFSETLPEAPIERIALLRLDGDMYESTMDILTHLYPKLSVGGYCIVDDYKAVPACRPAVDDYRREHGITEEIVEIDWAGVYWQRLRT
ncbi:MAG TPA: TylF/MycF family methyltransferase [Pyrinomonadaceae bacterium]|jgi:O-methyltransferase